MLQNLGLGRTLEQAKQAADAISFATGHSPALAGPSRYGTLRLASSIDNLILQYSKSRGPDCGVDKVIWKDGGMMTFTKERQRFALLTIRYQ